MWNNKKMTEIMCKIFGWKTESSSVRFHFWQIFVQKVLYFGYKHFLTVLMENNNQMTKNYEQIVWVQKEIMMCWFVTFGSFRA